MQLSNEHHLTYCLNVHRGEDWEDQLEAVKQYLPSLKATVSPHEPMGVGLRVSAMAAETLIQKEPLESFKHELDRLGLYVFTINGFPYGPFHGQAVKEKVYQPDWSTPERLDYTLKLIDILAELLPEGLDGSISTVPVSFKEWMQPGDASFSRAIQHLADAALHCHRLEKQSGAYIHLGLEPEPACLLETTDETLSFFKKALWADGLSYLGTTYDYGSDRGLRLLKRHVGVCFDCCHLAIQYEDLALSLNRLQTEGIKLSKIHLSAALHLDDLNHIDQLRPFEEPVYLHQVKAQTPEGLVSYVDLPPALEELPHRPEILSARIHFHVPLGWPGSSSLGTTREQMDVAFWIWINQQQGLHLEIETYTWDVLPERVAHQDLSESLADEYRWVLAAVGGK